MKPILLIIMDGFGISSTVVGNAVKQAHTPNLNAIFSESPYTLLEASGERVGLPKGQMGNSEVGHTNIGAGRVVYQDLTYINKCINDKSFYRNNKLCETMRYVEKNGSALHLMGLLSDGGVHSNINHLYALLEMASKYKIKKIYIHAWTDGRDTPPKSAVKYLSSLETFIKPFGNCQIATICGRFYSMDRDNRRERTKEAYLAMAYAKGTLFENIKKEMLKNYSLGITDEFINPLVNKEYGGMNEEDGAICFNFRPDRVRQITRMFLLNSEEFQNEKSIKKYTCFTEYESTLPCSAAFNLPKIRETLGECISKKGYSQLRIAETEKYAHVTFFLNAGRETPYPDEDRVIIKSPSVKTYDLKPEMSAEEITLETIKRINFRKYDFMVVNYANADMVGHTGNIEATVKAVEKVDKCVGKLVSEMKKTNGITLITADHGNAEKMLDSQKNIFTSHTCNKVPFAVVGGGYNLRKGGALCDVAPTILDLLGIEKSYEMTGESLVVN